MTKSLMNQRGSVLIAGMLLMLVMAILGIASMRSTGLQEKMAGNLGSREVAFQAAEITLREAENELNVLVNPAWDGTGGLYSEWDAAATTTPIWDSISWNDADSRQYDGTIAGVFAPPRYIIERLGQSSADCDGSEDIASDTPVPEPSLYRITARATGMTNTAVVTLQSTFKVCN